MNLIEDSIEMYDQAIRLNPKYLEAYNNKGFYIILKIGHSYYMLNQHERAIEIFD